MLNVWADGLCVILLAASAFYDAKSRRIPNWIVVSGMIFGLTTNAVADQGIGLSAATLGLIAGLVAFIPFFVLRVLGAGDVKLIAMVGSFLGASHLVGAMLTSFLVGGLLAIGFAMHAGQLGRMFGNIRLILFGMLMRATLPGAPPVMAPAPAVRIPYGIAIAAGTTLYLLWRNAPGVLP